MRSRIALACGVVGLLLLGLGFLDPPQTGAFRPYLLLAGGGLLLLGLATATLRRRPRREIDVIAGDARQVAAEDVGVLEPAAPIAPPRAEVLLLVGGNGASEPSVRWYQVAAATATHVAATNARVSVSVRGEHAGVEHWQWLTGDQAVDLMQTGARIPIVIGRVRESAEPIGAGWVVPFKNWYLTPIAISALGPFLAPFIAGFRHVFDVSVIWEERGIAQSASASFELRFWREPASEPRFIRIGDRPSYRDQAGGLGELRDRGTALRKEGMMLPLAALGVWLGRVVSWTSETRSLIAEVSTADSDYFSVLKTFDAPLFEGVRLHDDRHRQALRELHERLVRLQFFMRPGGT